MSRFLPLGVFVGFLLLLPLQTFAQQPVVFSDIAGTNARTAVEFLHDKKIVEGFADGSFLPDKSITRAEFLKIVLKSKSDIAADCDAKKTFTDVTGEDWFFPFVCAAVNSDIIQGYADDTFRPHDNINFRDAAKIVAKVNELVITDKNTADWSAPFTDAIKRERVLPGSISDSAALLTRGEMAQMVWGISTGNEVTNDSLGELPRIASCDELGAQLHKFEQRNANGGRPAFGRAGEMIVDDMAMDRAETEILPTLSAESDKAADDFSGTNVQEEGVDEADIVKNDGSHIFLVKNNTLRIIRAYPADQLRQEAIITLSDSQITPQELFLDNNTLTVIGSHQQAWENPGKPVPMMEDFAPSDRMIMPPYWSQPQQTTVIVYDITDRANPKKLRSVTIDGSYLSARRIDETVFVATSRYNQIYGLPQPFDPEPFLPMMEDSAFVDMPTKIGCADFRYVPNFSSNSTLIVTGIPTNNLGKQAFREVVLGAGESVYASLKNMFVTHTTWGENFLDNGTDSGWFNEEQTEVYRFALAPDSVTFTGKTEARGRVLNQFAMSEFDVYFRIATQAGDAWGNNLSETLVTIFDKDLKQTGVIDKIAPGENIKSARFIGNRAFLVTFKTVDPLFVIDLSPTNPTILGKLKIPGWSDYLHPWDENHLIGFGKEVDESIDADKVHSDSAVYYTAVLGMKIAIFDISDVANPKEIHKQIIGNRGTTSEVLTNHKALLVDTEKGIIGFPITITENKNGKVGSDADIQTTFAGAQVYDVSLADGFSLRGEVSHYEDDGIYQKSGEYFYGDPDLNIQRIIYIGENFYSISPNIIKALNWQNLGVLKTLMLDKRTCEQIGTENECSSRSDCTAVFQTFEECRRNFGEEVVCEGEPQFARCEAAK